MNNMWLISYVKVVKQWSNKLQEDFSVERTYTELTPLSPFDFAQENEIGRFDKFRKIVYAYKLTDEEVKDYVENS